ncbi:hypothetical protein BDY19DRAFT_895853 [Irpex rosettiformis]|uniref:Uncharacterized protein n=1 Tax=Irpex rosettiformis TaxID=378272 RepID=A0ACB8TVF1_9APHY|nr:hypothetical protein BDY19DRAFT_895853 [Irpex rosettiformis]
MADTIGKWAPGSSYGPVLSQTDLYLLNPTLEINPILAGTSSAFQLQFNIATGLTGGFNADVRDRELPFTAKDEPATLPRVAELVIITELSPWCTIVKNPQGVTLNDVCQAVWKEYTENNVTDKEFESLPPRVQEHIKRLAASNAAQQSGMYSGYFSPANVPSRFRRVDWLRDKVYFERLVKKDPYVKNRLGFSAPNTFVMMLY